MKEIIVTYNADQLGYDPNGGLEQVIDIFEQDPKPESALYVANTRFGVELGAIIATYTTDDPKALLERIKVAYGTAISYVEEGGPMEAYTAPDAEREEGEEETDRTD
ncbi:MAG: hypothetical protein ACMXYM_00230 [Candidatus Woesearchaeota archaeon]